LLSGRYFTDRDDRETESVAVINHAAAQNRWRNEDPIGRRVSFNNGRTWLKIVGVVGDVKSYGLDRDANEQIFVPLKQSGNSNYLLVRTAAEPLNLATALRNAVHEVDNETAVDRVQTLEFAREEYLASPQLTAVLIALFAGLALLITSAGIAGVMALSVNQRTHELGVRLALGATPAKVLWLVMRQGMLMAVAGLAIGAGGALVLSRFVQSLLFSTEPDDPITFIAVSAVLLAVAAIACFVPARRVTEIDPMIALRSE
jgi:predicted permease